MAIDGSNQSKWLCHATKAQLHLVLIRPATIAAYELTSANDFPDRDPNRWTLRCRESPPSPFVEVMPPCGCWLVDSCWLLDAQSLLAAGCWPPADAPLSLLATS